MATNIEEQWAKIALSQSMASTPEEDALLKQQVASTNTITDRLLKMEENARIKAENLTLKEQEKTQKQNEINGLESFIADLQNKNAQGANWDDATSLQESLGQFANYGLQTDESGQRYYIDPSSGSKVNYYGKEKGLYVAETDNGQMKLGLRAGDKTFEDRYTPDWKQYVPFMKGYGWKPGPEGVVADKDPYMDLTVPAALADAYEKYVHSNAGQLAERTAGQGPISAEMAYKLGAGKTEYTKQSAPMWNADYDVSSVELREDTPLPGAHSNAALFGEDGRIIRKDTDGYFGNLIDAAQHGLGRTAASTGDTIVDIATRGSKELAEKFGGVSEEESNKIITKSAIGKLFNENGNFTGFDKYKDAKEYGYDASAINDYGQELKYVLTSDKATFTDKAMSILKAPVYAPELMASSIGDIVLAATGPVGMGVFSANIMNDILEEKQKIMKTSDLDPSQYVIAGTAAVVAGLANQITGGMAGATKGLTVDLIKEGLKKVDSTAFQRIVTAVGAGTLEEATEEGIQELAQIVGTKLGTPEQDQIMTEKTAVDVGASAIMGGGAGAGMSGARAGFSELGKSEAIKNGINTVSEKIKHTKPSEPVNDNAPEASEVIDENQKAVYETNFTDAETRLEALTPLALREDVSNDEYMSGFEEINAIKEHIINGMKSGTIDKARSDVAVAKLKDINAKMHAGVIKMMNDGDEQAMTTLFSDPETAETKFRKIATSGSEDLDLDGANFMKAGFSAGLDEETIADIKDEAKALNKLSGTGKSIDKVAQEVSTEAKGYLTYKDLADEGIESNNVGKINKNLVSMEKFYGKHSAKLEAIEIGLAEATEKVSKIVNDFAESRKISKEEALVKLEKVSGQTQVTYPSGQIGKINHSDIVRKLKDENYNGGMFSIRNSVKNETEAMGTVFEFTKKRAERIGTFAKQFTDKTEVDYVNEIKNLEPEVVKLREKVAKYKMLDEEDLSDNAKASIKELPKMEAKLKAAQDNIAKIKGTKVDNKTDTSTSGSENKVPEAPGDPKDVAVETPKDTVVKSFVKPPEESAIEAPKDPTEINSAPKDTNVSFVKPIDEIDIPKDYTVNTFVPPLEQEIPTMVDNEYDFVKAEQTFIEPDDVPTADDIAKFDNIDSISDKTDKEKAVKSKVIEQLEESLENARAKLAKVKEKYIKGREAVNKLVEKRKAIIAEYGDVRESSEEIREEYFDIIDPLNEQIEDAFSKLDTYIEEVVNPYKELVSGLNAKLSGSAEIESIIKDTGLGSIVSEKTKMIEKDKDGNYKYQIIKSSDIVKGNKKATNRLSGMKIEDITDNKTVLNYADSAIETLSNVIDKVEKKYNKFGKEIESDKILTDVNGIESGLKEVQKLRDSLFRGILFNADGSINKNVATAIAMTGDEYRALMASKLAFNTKEDIAKMLGITEGEVTGLMTRTMTFNGSFKKIIADDLSTTLFKNLAISGVDTADKELVAKMKADVGQIVLLYMQEKGYIEPLATSTMTVKQYETMMEKDEDFAKETFTELGESENGATIPMVRLAGTRDANGNQIRLKGKAKETHNKKFADEIAKITKTLDVLGSTFGIESTKKGYKTKPSKTDSKKVKNSKVNNMSDKALKTMNVLQAESFEMNGGVEVLFELLDNGTIDNATILKAMGYKTETDLKGKSFNTIESAEARNMEIVNSLDELKSLRARVLDPEDEMTNEMYFDYFFGKNGRFYMDSVGINPQTEKQLHRWLITPKSHNVTIDFGAKGKAKRQKDMFRLAIAQAFGFAIDKKSNADSYAFADAIMSANESELLKVLKPDEKGHFEHKIGEHKLEIEHIGHTMQAISALRAYRDANGGPFTTSMSVEFDAVTSGFIIKLMQMPILEMKMVKEWLAKGGVFLGGADGYNGGDIKDIKSMSDVIAKNGITDAYRTLAGKMKTPTEVTDNYSGKETELGRKKIATANRILGAITPLLGNIKNDIDEVTKEGRALFKDPFMTFNYAAGMASIKRSLGYKMTENLADEMLIGSEKGNALIGALFGIEFNKIDKNVLADFKEQILTKDFDEVVINGKVKVSELMRKIIEDAYGSQVESILGEEFEGLVKANGTINNAFKGVFLAWKKEYDAKVAETIAKGGVLSSKVEDEIILALKDKFPMINAPLSSGNIEDLETVAIYSTKLSSGKDKKYGAAKTYINKNVSENNPKGQQTLTVQSMIREFESAMSAGAVIPIHYIDGSFMTNVLEASGVLGVHDAVVTGIDNAFDTVKNYNKNVYENSRDYSVIEELSKLVNRNAKGNESIIIREAKGENEAITFGDIVNDLNKLNAEVKEARRVLFNTDVKVMHMTAIDDTDYSEIDGQGTVKKANELVEYAEPEIKETTDKKSENTKTPGSDDIVKESAGLTVTKSGLVRYKGTNKSQKKIESYAEFKSIVNEYASIMNSKKVEGDKTTDSMNQYVDSMFEMLANSGIEFRPFELKFSKNVGDNNSGLGLHKTYDSGLTIITMPFDVDFGNESPLRVVLHEYAHSVTKKAMKDNPSLMKKANELRDYAIKKLKESGMTQDEINKTYAFSDKKDEAYEFIAEALTSPKFQVMLNKILSISENKNVLEDIKKFFNAIVKFVTKNNESKFEINSVLADTLNLVLEIQNENGLLNKDYNSEPDVSNSTDDIGIINEENKIVESVTKEDSEQSEPDVDNKYKTISKDDIEAAKDIMSNNKKECE